MKLKEGVTFEGISLELAEALALADQIYLAWAGRELVLTSLKDGKHSKKSLHYSGNAADLRTRDLTPRQQATILSELKLALGKDYDVVLEIDHIHLEYDPKK